MAAEYVAKEGNERVLLCERGIKTFERSTHYTLDLSAVPVLKRETHPPVIVDPSHAAGRSDSCSRSARAAAVAGGRRHDPRPPRPRTRSATARSRSGSANSARFADESARRSPSWARRSVSQCASSPCRLSSGMSPCPATSPSLAPCCSAPSARARRGSGFGRSGDTEPMIAAVRLARRRGRRARRRHAHGPAPAFAARARPTRPSTAATRER